MSIISTATLYHRDGHEKIFTAAEISRMASCGQVGAGKDWSSVAPAPLNWQFEIPRYRVTRDLKPAQKARFRFEPPFSETWESDCWQYGERPLVTGEEIETTNWPHPSMRPLNYSGEKVLAFYIGAMKSRLTVSPWHNGQVRLDNGLSNVPILSEVKSPSPAPFNSRPAA
jgi:hypothetical protein